jgi:hypothetical protein
MVKQHGENSQSAQAIELGQIGLALHATVAKAFLRGTPYIKRSIRRLIHQSVFRATYHAMRPRRVTGLRVMRWQDNTAGGGR